MQRLTQASEQHAVWGLSVYQARQYTETAAHGRITASGLSLCELACIQEAYIDTECILEVRDCALTRSRIKFLFFIDKYANTA